MTTENPARRRRRRFLLAVLALGGSMAAGLTAWPPIRRAIRERNVGSALAAGRLVEAEADLAAWIEREPLDPRPRLLLAGLRRRQGRLTEAEEALQRAIELGLSIDECRDEHRSIVQALKGR